MVLRLLEIGAGKSSLERLYSVLNMPKAMSDDTFIESVTKIKSALELEASLGMKKAAKEEHPSEDEVAECKAIFNETWETSPQGNGLSSSIKAILCELLLV